MWFYYPTFPPGLDGFLILNDYYYFYFDHLFLTSKTFRQYIAYHLILPSPWIPLSCITVVNLRALDRSSIAFESKLCPVKGSKHKRCLWTAGCVWVQAKTEIPPLSCWYGCVSSALCASSTPPPSPLTLQGPSVLWLTLPPPFCVFFLFLFLSPFLCLSTCLLLLTGIFPNAGAVGSLILPPLHLSVSRFLSVSVYVPFFTSISLFPASLTVVVKRPSSTLSLTPLSSVMWPLDDSNDNSRVQPTQNTSEQFGPVNLMTRAVNVTTA